jgi:hypothetical protein
MNKLIKIIKQLDVVSWICVIILIIITIWSFTLGLLKKYILQYIINFILGLVINYVILYVILLGSFAGGLNLKELIFPFAHEGNKIAAAQRLNKILFLFLGLYLILIFNMDTLYLDGPNKNVKIDDIDFKISGEYKDKIFTHFGGSAALVVGAKIAASFIVKLRSSHMLVSNKLFSSFAAASIPPASGGRAFSTGYQVINTGNEKLINFFKYKVDNKNVEISVDKVEIYTDLNKSISGDKNTTSKLESFLPKFKNSNGKFKFSDYNKQINHVFNKAALQSFIVDSKSNILSNLNKCKTLTVIFKNKAAQLSLNLNINTTINSPLELNNLDRLNDIKDIVTLLNYNLVLNIVMIYLLYVLIVVLTLKFITDKNINLDKIKIYPLGKYIFFLISKLINIWKINNLFFIYFLLFSLFIFSCISTFGIYVSVVVLS